MGNLLTKTMGNVLTMMVGNVLTEGMGKVLDIYNFPRMKKQDNSAAYDK
ncbi:MAG: hypothetical protein WBC20_06870 [Candidatus Aminicenantaceae bacterium]